MDTKNIYYNRILSGPAEKTILMNFKWLIDFVKAEAGNKLDFQITFNCNKKGSGNDATIPDKQRGTSRFSIYRGTSRILSLVFSTSGKISIDAADSYRKHCSPSKDFFTPGGLSKEKLIVYLEKITDNTDRYGRYYINKENMRVEGFYQNLINRRYTLTPQQGDDFIIFDREFEFGFSCGEAENLQNTDAKDVIKKSKENAKQHALGAKSPKTIFTNDYENKDSFDEIDGVGINQNGDILIIEIKHPQNNTGIVYGPMQVRYYIEQLRKAISDNVYREEFYDNIKRIIEQKSRMGILNLPQNWKIPIKLSGKIIPYLVVGSIEDTPILKSPELISRFNVIRQAFDDKEFPLQVKVCQSLTNGTLVDYTIK